MPCSRVARVPRSPATASESCKRRELGRAREVQRRDAAARRWRGPDGRVRTRRPSRAPWSAGRDSRASRRSPPRRSPSLPAGWTGRRALAPASRPVRLSLDARNAVRMSCSGGDSSVAIVVDSFGAVPRVDGPTLTPRRMRSRASWSAALIAGSVDRARARRSPEAVVDGQCADAGRSPGPRDSVEGQTEQVPGGVVARVVARRPRPGWRGRRPRRCRPRASPTEWWRHPW